MNIKSVETRYVEFFSSIEGHLQWLTFHELNGRPPLDYLPQNATAYRLFEITDRVEEDGTILRSARRDREIQYI